MAGDPRAGGFGAFGKIPSLGDFFRINLSAEFIDPWDQFVQSALLSGREALGEGWTGFYMTAPIWRFTLAPGVAGPAAMAGVLMPSVDRVGRQFPLTLAGPGPAAQPLSALLRYPDIFAALEHIALESLDDSMDRDGLAARLAQLPGLPAAAAVPVRAPGGGQLISALADRHLVADLALAGAPDLPVVFSATAGGAARLMALPALPQGAAAAALFDLEAPFWREERG